MKGGSREGKEEGRRKRNRSRKGEEEDKVEKWRNTEQWEG